MHEWTKGNQTYRQSVIWTPILCPAEAGLMKSCFKTMFVCLYCGFTAQSTAKVMSSWSVTH